MKVCLIEERERDGIVGIVGSISSLEVGKKLKARKREEVNSYLIRGK